jgi:valyl-tRNA synthetase
VLAHILERVLRLLHPFTPFVTEEVWQNLIQRLPRESNQPESIVIAPYPQADSSKFDALVEEEVQLIIDAIRSIRNIRSQLRIEPAKHIKAVVTCDMPEIFEDEREVVHALARVEPLELGGDSEPANDSVVTVVLGKATIRLSLGGVVDISKERKRLSAELGQCYANTKRIDALLSNEQFASRAPEEVVERETERLARLKEQQRGLEEVISQLGS